MTFEEFFKKKKINLTTFSQAEGGLFSEFKKHYELMGEKSFDHTKKYWFNKLRRLYPPPPEVKAEKIVMENRLAEQTITETLTEPAPNPATQTGFTPRFKVGVTAANPAEQKPEQEAKAENTEQQATTPPPAKVGFTPRFKANLTTKPIEPEPEAETKAEDAGSHEVTPSPAKVGFTPRFKAGVTTKPVEPEPEAETKPDTDSELPPPPKVGFKPKFKPPQK